MRKLYIYIVLTSLLTAINGCGEKTAVPEAVKNAIALPSGDHDFDTSTGNRQARRVPLQYPYQLSSNYNSSSGDHCILTKITPDKVVADAIPTSTIWLKSVAPSKEFVAFEQKRFSDAMLDYDRFGIFYYDTGKYQLFSSKAEIAETVKNRYGITEELVYYSFDELFQYFKAISSERD